MPETQQTSTKTAPAVSHGGGNDGDHDRFAHYIKKQSFDSAVFDGAEVEALCGKVWVPKHDATRYPICPTCKEIFERLPPE
jgi:hypothetical protein